MPYWQIFRSRRWRDMRCWLLDSPETARGGPMVEGKLCAHSLVPPATLRERRRRRQAGAIERVALKLFAERGYASVTIDQIATAAEISPRTFFRYFENKEDVLFGDRQRYEDTL